MNFEAFAEKLTEKNSKFVKLLEQCSNSIEVYNLATDYGLELKYEEFMKNMELLHNCMLGVIEKE